MSTEREASWLQLVQTASRELHYAHYKAWVHVIGARLDVDDNLGGDPVEEAYVGEGLDATVWIGIPGIASGLLRDQLAELRRSFLPEPMRPATLAAREAALRDAGARAYTIEIDIKLAQLCSTCVAVIDFIEARG